MASTAKKHIERSSTQSSGSRPRLRVKRHSDPGIAAARADWSAYERDRESLLSANKGWYVAYSGGKRIALAPTRDDAIKAVESLQTFGLVMIHRVCAKDEEPRVSLSGPRG